LIHPGAGIIRIPMMGKRGFTLFLQRRGFVWFSAGPTGAFIWLGAHLPRRNTVEETRWEFRCRDNNLPKPYHALASIPAGRD
jgi:hypothetical protein